MYRKLFAQIASTVQAYQNCRKMDKVSEWEDKHLERLEYIAKELLPSGSGIDSGTKIDLDRSSSKRIVLTFGYHHMNDAGMYDGWTEHALHVTPSFDGVDLRITGPNRNNVKDYLYDVFYRALTQDVDIRE